MREILFRGKRVDNGEWAESPYPYGTMSSGVVQHDFISQTVGQYTGHTDKNEKKIFEGDIIKYETPDCSVIYGTINFGEYAIYNIGFYISWPNYLYVRQDLGFWLKQREIVIIGNIYDNPELIEDMDIKPAAKRGDAPAEQLALAPAT